MKVFLYDVIVVKNIDEVCLFVDVKVWIEDVFEIFLLCYEEVIKMKILVVIVNVIDLYIL